MASKYLQKYPIPAGFQEILADFTREILRDQPPNIIEYAAKYFETLEAGKKFQFDSKYNVRKDEKKYELAYNPKNAEQITKKATNIASQIENETEVKIQAKENEEENEIQEEKAFEALADVVERIFNEFDEDKNGFLESKEIERFVRRALASVGYHDEPNFEEIQTTMSMIDENRDGKISKEELFEFVKKLAGL